MRPTDSLSPAFSASVSQLKTRIKNHDQLLSGHLLAVFLLSFGFIFIYWVGLPADFNSDHITINLRGAQASSYADLLGRVLNPLTPAWFYPADRAMEYLRPLQFLGMKALFDLFGPSLIPFHLTAALGLGCLCSFMFWLIRRWTKSLVVAWLAVFLYATFPSNFFMLGSTFSGDFQYFLSILSIASLLIFSRLTWEDSLSLLKRVGWTALWIISIWLAIKLKSSEKILPFICLAFLILRNRVIIERIGKMRFVTLLVLVFSAMILVIPLKPVKTPAPAQTEITSEESFADKDKKTFSFHWQNMLQRTFFVPGKKPSPFRPRSFTENFGPTLDDDEIWGRIPYFGILFWIVFLSGISRLFFGKPSANSLEEAQVSIRTKHEVWIITIWFGATLAGFANGLDVNDIRFLNFAYVPGILCFFAFLHEPFQLLRPKWLPKLLWNLLLSAAVITPVIFNTLIYNKLTIHLAGMQDALVRAEKDIYRAISLPVPQGWELYEKHADLEKEDSVILSDWYESANLKSAEEIIAKNGFVYVYSTKSNPTDKEKPTLLPELIEKGYSVELSKRYDLLEGSPIIFKILKGVKKKRYDLFVYRVTPPAAATAI